MTSRTRWSLLGATAIVLIVAQSILSFLKPSNCGGNSAALAACNSYLTALQLWADDHGGESFRLDQVDTKTKRKLADLPGASWLPSSRFMARVDGVCVDVAAEKRILMVCDHAFDNVPQRVLGRSPMAHAVAYSTGKTGLISPQEYARLDLSGFIDLQTLAASISVDER